MPPEKSLTPREVAEILGLSPITLAIWRSKGTYALPYVTVGRKVLYQPEAIEQFVRERTVGNQAGLLDPNS